MHTSKPYSLGPKDRYSAKRMEKPVKFYCYAPQAQKVSLIGDFNHWHPNAHPMKRQPDSAWVIEVPLSHGHHRYLFYVDGHPVLDPRAHGIARNEKNERCKGERGKLLIEPESARKSVRPLLGERVDGRDRIGLA